MFHHWKVAIGVLCTVGLMVGCQNQTPPTPAASSSDVVRNVGDKHNDHQVEGADPNLSAALTRLSPQDQPIANAQQFCAVMNQSRLGSMGTPLKLEIKGEPVFVCCSGCKAKALKNPNDTLAKVAALRARAKAAP